MKFLVAEIVQATINATPKSAQATILRLDYMPHPKIYLDVCLAMSSQAKSQGKSFVAKLSREKLGEFERTVSYRSYTNKLSDFGYTDDDGHMTYWRNSVAEKPGMVLLMGTESVEDRGGLADFHSITPLTIEQSLRRNLAAWAKTFVSDYEDKGEDGAHPIHEFLARVFKHVPVDLLKLSHVFEEISNKGVLSTAEFLAVLCDRQYSDWGLPRIGILTTNRRRLQLLDKAAKFSARNDYTDGLSESQLRKISAKIDEYERENPDITRDVDNQYRHMYSSYECLRASIIDYVTGVSLEESRKKLFQCDFALIDEILSLRIKATSTKESTPKVQGSPIDALLKIMLTVVQKERSAQRLVESLQYKIDSVRLAGCSTEEEVLSAWNNATAWSGGVLDFIKIERWVCGSQAIELGWQNDFDPLSPGSSDQMIKDGIVKSAAGSKKISAVELGVMAQPSGQLHQFVWEFDPLNSWAQAFSLLSVDLRQAMEGRGGQYLPLGICSRTMEMTQMANEYDFLAALDTISVSYENIHDIIVAKLPANKDAIGLSCVLSQAFADFAEHVWELGFYSTVSTRQSGPSLVAEYERTMDILVSGAYSSSVAQQLYLLANAFLITPGRREGLDAKQVNNALVPPYHPCMLEKIQAQAQFLRQGALELLEKMGNGVEVKIDKEFDRLLQLSTITSGVDVLIGPEDRYLPVRNTFAYYGQHCHVLNNDGLLSSMGGNKDVVSEDSSASSAIKKESALSRLFARKVLEYLSTFPFQSDDLSLVFINPPDLQPVVAGVHQVAQEMKKDLPSVKLTLHVMVPSLLKGGRGYLRFWLDNFFSEEDNVVIRTYCTIFDLQRPKSNSFLADSNFDIAFVQQPLEISSSRFEAMHRDQLPVTDCRYPMVYLSLPASKNSVERLISASQPQFRAAHKHAQFIYWLVHKYRKADNYRLVASLSLSKPWAEMLDVLHNRANWVVCVDGGIDREVIHSTDSRVISFATGVGPFGELNYTVSSSQSLQDDIVSRIKSQLKGKFPAWPEDSLKDIAINCMEQSRLLDGIRLLKALNPNDYGMHNFLAYILTAQEAGVIHEPHPDYAIRSLISLDMYAHWFDGGDTGTQPDFLLLEVPKGSTLSIRATLIECKMGACTETHLDKADKQLIAGYRRLADKWNPQSTNVDRRYWFAQLYRALIFSKINLEDNSPEYEAFVRSLHDLLDGKFSITWQAEILGYWLDGNYERQNDVVRPAEDGLRVIYRPMGQLYIHKMLRSLPSRDTVPVYLLLAPEDSFSEEVDQEDILDTDLDEEVVYTPRTDDGIIYAPEEQPEDLGIDVSKPTDDVAASDHYPANTDDVPDNCGDGTVSGQPALAGVRVLIGEDLRTREKTYWEYGHPNLPNRHILISGNSGTGKTYLIQSMMLDLARAGISCMVFDYTDGFTRSKLEPEFKAYLGDRIVEFPVYDKPFPLNPFKCHEIEVAGRLLPQKPVDVAERIKSVFQAVYKFGDQQASAVYKATRNGLDRHGDKMNLRHLQAELQRIVADIPNAKTVLSKIEPLVDREPFDGAGEQDWGQIRDNKGTVFVVQLSGFTRDVQLVITEIILWDAWYYNVKHGRKELPFPVILDEAQNLNHEQRSPSAMMLTEGRKFGWSGWFATQFMKNQLKVDEIQRLQQSSQKIYFCPPEAEIVDIAAHIEPERTLRQIWQTRLAQLRKGECVVMGYELRNGNLEKRPPRVVKVASMAERVEPHAQN